MRGNVINLKETIFQIPWTEKVGNIGNMGQKREIKESERNYIRRKKRNTQLMTIKLGARALCTMPSQAVPHCESVSLDV